MATRAKVREAARAQTTRSGRVPQSAIDAELQAFDDKDLRLGAAGASDYTQNRDPARKQRYLARHAPREHWDRPMTAGALARWLLWNRETLRESVADYLHRFDLTPG